MLRRITLAFLVALLAVSCAENPTQPAEQAGATEPDAKVTVQGVPVRLRPDGTFTMRFQLPDGVQEIPAIAVSRDGLSERQITPTVTRSTTRRSLEADPDTFEANGDDKETDSVTAADASQGETDQSLESRSAS